MGFIPTHGTNCEKAKSYPSACRYCGMSELIYLECTCLNPSKFFLDTRTGNKHYCEKMEKLHKELVTGGMNLDFAEKLVMGWSDSDIDHFRVFTKRGYQEKCGYQELKRAVIRRLNIIDWPKTIEEWKAVDMGLRALDQHIFFEHEGEVISVTEMGKRKEEERKYKKGMEGDKRTTTKHDVSPLLPSLDRAFFGYSKERTAAKNKGRWGDYAKAVEKMREPADRIVRLCMCKGATTLWDVYNDTMGNGDSFAEYILKHASQSVQDKAKAKKAAAKPSKP